MSAPFPLYVEVVTGKEQVQALLPGNFFSVFRELLEGTPSGDSVSFIVESEADVERYVAAIVLGAHGAGVSVVDDEGNDLPPIETLKRMPLSEGLHQQMEALGLLPLAPAVLSRKGGSEDPWFI
jgi:hypothetical protein